MEKIVIITLGLCLFYPYLATAQSSSYSDSYKYVYYEDLSALPDSNDTFEPKKRNKALAIALGSTFGPYVLAIIPGVNILAIPLLPVGPIVGPSMGYIYTDNEDMMVRGSTVRLGGAALFAFGTIGAFAAGYGGNQSFYAAGIIVMLSGIGIYTYRFVYDIIHSMRLVDKYNADHRNKGKVQLAPTFHPDSQSLGISLRVKF